MYQYTALVLAVLVAAAGSNTITFEDVPAFELLQNERSWDRAGLSASINSYLDSTISMLIPFIQNNGLDPMSLPDISTSFEVRPVIVTVRGQLRLNNGVLRGLVNIARSGDQRAYYNNKTLRVRLQLLFRDLQLGYNYAVNVLNISPSGGIVGSLERFTVTVDFLFDFANDEIQLQDFSLGEVGRLRVSLSGNDLVDWLVTPIVNLFLGIFDDTIIDAVQANIRVVIQTAVQNINVNLRETIRNLESFN